MDDERAGLIVKDILDGLRDVILRHGVTYPEYRRAIQFLAAAGERGELPLLCDVLLESVVDETTARAVPPGPHPRAVGGRRIRAAHHPGVLRRRPLAGARRRRRGPAVAGHEARARRRRRLRLPVRLRPGPGGLSTARRPSQRERASRIATERQLFPGTGSGSLVRLVVQ